MTFGKTLEARHGRATGKFLQISIADITQIFDADFAGEKSVGRKFAQEPEKFYSLAQARIFLRVLAIRDEVENFFLLLGCAVEIDLAVAIDADVVEPHQAPTERDLIVFVFAGD